MKTRLSEKAAAHISTDGLFDAIIEAAQIAKKEPEGKITRAALIEEIKDVCDALINYYCTRNYNKFVELASSTTNEHLYEMLKTALKEDE